MKLTLTTQEYTAIRNILFKGNEIFSNGNERRFVQQAIEMTMPSIDEARATIIKECVSSFTWTISMGQVNRMRMEMLTGMILSNHQADALFTNNDAVRVYTFRMAPTGDLEVEMEVSDADNTAIMDFYNKTIQTLEVLHEHRVLLHAAINMAKAIATTLKSVGTRCEAIWRKKTDK